MMMDVAELREFYASSLGSLARRLVMRRLRKFWPDMKGLNVAGVGFATPYLTVYREEAERVLGLMPATQGVVHWPPGATCATALVYEDALPLGDGTMDRLLSVHCLEMAEHASDMLTDFWRVLTPGGRLLVVVPNRRGLWARFDSTPFGHGRPYSRPQLARLLRASNFEPVGWQEGLFVPPARWRLAQRWAPALERTGAALPGFPAGVLAVEAVKQVQAAQPAVTTRLSRRLRPVLVPEAATSAPAPAPAERHP